MKPDQLTATVQGLRELANWLEANPGLPIGVWAGGTVEIAFSVDTPDQLRTVARAMGTFEKHPERSRVADVYYTIAKFFSGVDVHVRIWREKVCKKTKKLVEQDVFECPVSILDDGADEAEAQVAELHQSF